jgi:myxalamid-type polyketide synthase MxaB
VVEVVKADVSKLADTACPSAGSEALGMKNLLAHIKYPLRGIIHAAGLLDDGVLMQQSLSRLVRVMAPKIQGSWNLHLLTSPHPSPLPQGEGVSLDFFVMFSSAASLLGSPGQGNYAAANAFMDGLAHYRAAQGLPALSINWGPWGEGGMAADGTAGAHYQRRVAGQAIQPIEPEQAWRIFHELLTRELASPQVAVLNMNWAQFRQQFAGMGEPPLFAELGLERYPLTYPAKSGVKREERLPDSATLTRQELLEAAPDEREALLMAYLQEQVARALGLRVERLDSEQPLNMMGIDSLTALELRNQLKSDLELDVPVVKFLEGLSVLMLATYLNQELIAHASSAIGQNDTGSPHEEATSLLELMEDAQHAGDIFSELDELGEEDIDALLMAMSDKM